MFAFINIHIAANHSAQNTEHSAGGTMIGTDYSLFPLSYISPPASLIIPVTVFSFICYMSSVNSISPYRFLLHNLFF